jgi:hypothetical protein
MKDAFTHKEGASNKDVSPSEEKLRLGGLSNEILRNILTSRQALPSGTSVIPEC